ncbi:MAG TPA: HAMP domain-containing sensor histidine kinase [Gemmatimonadales bacterium]|nr:HAMP domain-containing sensor histidine kinase [Gemmatimonadales bacterium]
MFGLMALLMATLVAVTTYVIAHDYLWQQRQEIALRQAVGHARTVNEELGTSGASVRHLLVQVDSRGGQAAAPLLLRQGRWYDGRYPPGHESLPPPLVSMVTDGEAVMQRFRTPRGLVFAVALPVDGGVFVEVFALAEFERTLRTLGVILAFTTTLATVVGVLIGGWASRRALVPLTSLTSAASKIVRGELGTRLPAQVDPDLGPIAEAFNSTAAQLQERVERDARFAGNVSHELRTPVTAMVNAVDILGSRADRLDPEAREVLAFLAHDVHRFAGMVSELLEISRFDAGAADLRAEEVPLRTYVQRVVDRRVGRPVTVADGDGRLAVIDTRLIGRVLENLADNAERHGNGLTRVLVEENDRSARILFDDAGPGVPPEFRERIFERFARVPGPVGGVEGGGVGLGLALVADNVKAHGGRVWVESSPDGGARFVVELPLT